MNSATATPLSGPLPKEIPLPQAPLVRVLAQVKFPTILSIGTNESEVAAFQEKIRSSYPILEREQSFNVVLGTPSTPPEVRSGVIWRFRDLNGSWRVTLTPDFVTLEALQYSSRSDFVTRLEAILAAVHSSYVPSVALRIGVRYVDCIKPPHVERIEDLFQPAVLGIHKTPLGEAAEVNVTECLLRAEEGLIQCRWGLIPPGATHDASILPPAEEASWILDLDMYSDTQMPFEVEELSEVVRSFAGRLYSVFRWMIQDEFLRAYGGTL